MTTTLPIPLDSDAALVERSRRRDLRAFEQIVARYQTLVCSVALAAVGDVGRSEDLAQEVFLTAWQRLPELREPAALRSWLCGIARNLAANALRRRRVTHPIDPTLESAQPSPPDQAAGREEQAILSRSLEKIPFIYRQPLILFYRQDQSVRLVAEVMNLSEETVRQRLSRGRKLLQAEVSALLESALRQSAPRRAFTMAVLAALPVAATSAKAATISAAAAKGSAVALSAGAVAWFSALLGPIIAILAGYAGYRAGLNSTRTPAQRRSVISYSKRIIACTLLFDAVVAIYVALACRPGIWSSHLYMMVGLGIGFPLAYVILIICSIVRYNLAYRSLTAQEQLLHPEAFIDRRGTWLSRDYCSPIRFLGLPLVHIRVGRPFEKAIPAIGWIAFGDCAYGLLFAAGGLAVGAISTGGIAIGILPFGGISLGLAGAGGLAIAAVALGGVAIGLIASGGIAAGWYGAIGGVVMARRFAIGGAGAAPHLNDPAAREFWSHHLWLDVTQALHRNVAVTLIWLPALLLLFWWPKRKRMGE